MEYIKLYLIFSMVATLWLDTTRYTIPNWLTGSILLLYPVALYLSPEAVDWKMAIAAMLATFAAGYVLFSLRLMGGGDVKLIAALALWVGWSKLPDFVLLFALLGGVFALLLLLLRRIRLYLPWKERFKTPRILQEGAPIAYGVPIALAFLWLMHKGEVAMLGSL